MNPKDSESVIKQEILGYRNYKSKKSEFFKEDFEEIETLQKFLAEVFVGESDVTEIGKTFLLKRLGESNVAQKVMDLGGVYMNNITSQEELITAVEKHKPHEIAFFISEARKKANK